MADVARTAAFEALKRVEKDGAFSNLATAKLRELSPVDNGFATALVMGVLETRRALDHLICLYAKKLPEGDLLTLLRLGVYQLFYMDRVPESAACNETVRLAKRFCGEKRAGFANAVLRSLCRERDAAVASLDDAPPEIRYSFGDGVTSLLKEQYPHEWEEILKGFCQKQPLTLRVNTLKVSAGEVAARYNAAAEGTMVTLWENQAEAVKQIPEGEYFVQGYGSQMAVKMLDPRPNHFVVDVCACPGGKSLGAAIAMENLGKVLSMDLHGNKLPLIQKSAKTLGITIIETKQHDGRKADPSLAGRADRVICDVPCSGLGVVGAKPEIRYKDPAEFAGLYATQREILRAVSTYVNEGGCLVYSTCTLNKLENEEVVKDFLAHTEGFVLQEEHTWLPVGDGREGFYAARLMKKNGEN